MASPEATGGTAVDLTTATRRAESVEQYAAPRGRTVRIARHEGADAIKRVGGDAPAVAQTACQLAVVDGAAAESRTPQVRAHGKIR